jgi:hypothetical protein
MVRFNKLNEVEDKVWYQIKINNQETTKLKQETYKFG